MEVGKIAKLLTISLEPSDRYCTTTRQTLHINTGVQINEKSSKFNEI